MDTRAPRFGQIEIPLTIVDKLEKQVQCACLNVSGTGAMLRFESGYSVELGAVFHSNMMRAGRLVKVWMQVERISSEGVGVGFIQANKGPS